MPKDKPKTEQTPKGLTVPVPKRNEFFGNLKKAATPEAGAADGWLVRAWGLWAEDPTDEVDDELERLLPGLVAAGYAATDDESDSWRFTPTGVARAKELVSEDDDASSGSQREPEAS
jgi:hypothetical protein